MSGTVNRDNDPGGTDDTTGRGGASWSERPALPGALLVVLLVLCGVGLGVGDGGATTVVVAGVLVPLIVGCCFLLVRAVNRGSARESGVPYASFVSLSRRIRKGDIPRDPSERTAMRRLLAKQRPATARLWRFRWMFVALGAVFLLNSVLKFLEGEFLTGTLLLLGALGQFAQPFAQRDTLRRLDRAEAGLDAADHGAR